MIKYNEDEKRKIIMDYYLNPRNKVDSFENKNYQNIYLHSNACVDEITLFYNKSLNDFKFEAKGCAIFLSSSEIFIERINEIGSDKISTLIELYDNLIDRKPLLDEQIELLGKLNIYENVAKHLNRKECALMISKVFKKI